MESELPERVKNLLKNDFDDIDIGSFRIKKKKKFLNQAKDEGDKGATSEANILNDRMNHLKVEEMNVIKIYNDIIEKASADDNYFQVIRSIISIGNRSLVSFEPIFSIFFEKNFEIFLLDFGL